MAGESKQTADHETIRKWAEERGGHPAAVSKTGGKDTGILRIDFPGYSGQEKLEEISWKEFFDKFDESHLALVYQDWTKDGKLSRFNKLISRERH